MDADQQWERLIESLDAWTSATEVEPGRIAVTLPAADGPSRRVVIVMTPDEWDDMVGIMWSNVDDAIEDVKRTLAQLRPDERFAVYDQYRLMPAGGSALPEDPDTAKLTELLQRYPDGFGRWSAYPPHQGER